MTYFSLLPNARTRLSSTAAAPAPGQSRRRIAFGVEIRAEGAAIGTRLDVGAELLSAGDVIGVDPRMITRVEPASSANGFEPNYMPFIEFADADFPWRYSFEPGTGPRIRPWLVLLALLPNEFEFFEPSDGPVPRIRIKDPRFTLPALAQSWAYAHVHVSQGSARLDVVPSMIENEPETHSSRLLCPRRLEPNSSYTLALVPATAAGRTAGLGLSETAIPADQPAWDGSTEADFELPIYFHSRFSTSVVEDFELLARRLAPFRLTAPSGAANPQKATADTPGFYQAYSNPGATFEIQDALIRADQAVEAFNTDPQLSTRLESTLAAVIGGEEPPTGDNKDAQDPLVAMPAYGWRFRNQKTISAAQAGAGRFVDRINLDLKFRHAAGLGARTVRRNQEEFSRICWSQYREVVASNLALARLRTAKELTDTFLRRHASRLPATTLAVLTESLHDLTLVPGGVTIADTFANAGVPASFISRGLRRLAAKRPMRASGGSRRIFLPAPTIPGVGRRAQSRAAAVPALPSAASAEISSLFGTNVLVTAQRSARRAIAIGPIDPSPIAAQVASFFTGLPNRKARAILLGLANKEADKLEPVLRSPIVATPLVEPLRAIESDAILRGLDDVPINTVSVLQENRAFVEAFLCGANHEMNHELRWREFPTDMRGTIFRRFWNRNLPATDPKGDDLAPIDGWTKALGSNYPPHDKDRRASLVLLVRGDIIRKFGMILILLNRAAGSTYVHGSGLDSAPIFSGQLGADAAYYGFDVSRDTVLANVQKYFFILYEAPGRVRFGLDVATAAVRRDRFDFKVANLSFPLKLLDRDPKKPLLPEHLRTGHSAPAGIAKWDELSWSHMKLDEARYINVITTSPSVAEAPNYWPAGNARDSAKIARSFWQKPVAAILPAKRVLS